MSTLTNTPAARFAPPQPSGAKVLRFRKATKEAAKLRLALIGGSKSGKTYTALAIAQALVPGGRIAVIDTEHRSASKYAGPTATPHAFDFDTLELDSFHPRAYIDAIRAAEAEGYDVLIIDSLSHEWMGPDGALELVDRAAKKYAGNSYVAWGDVTPVHREMIEAILKAKLHVIATMRAKTEYVLEERNGKKVPRKIGLAPVQREGIEYEFDVACELTQEHDLSVMTSSRCEGMNGRVFRKAGADVAQILRAWLSDGGAPASPVAPLAPLAQAAPRTQELEPIPHGVSEAEAKVVREIGPALDSATTEAEVEALRKHALSLLPTDDQGKTVATPAYRAWHKARLGAAFERVGGGVR
jgi:AAA domain